MAVNLSKGQRVSLDKGMTMALVGLGWDVNQYDGGADFDLDASAFLLGANGKVRKDEDFIFYGNLDSQDGSVHHTGDNLTGEGEGDDAAEEHEPEEGVGDAEEQGVGLGAEERRASHQRVDVA